MKTSRPLAVVGISLALLAGTTAVAQPSMADSSKTCNSTSMRQKVGKDTPVILVHGLNSSGDTWGSQNDKTAMVNVIKRVKGVYLDEPFDYKSTSTNWVANDNIGPRLARRIDCLATASQQAGGPGKVVLLGHSMGGLAVRFAANQKVYGRDVGSKIGLLITLGTPNLGSGWANVGTNTLRTLCNLRLPVTEQASSCDVDALVGLRTNSDQIKELPWMPETVPVLAIAGDVTLKAHIGVAPVSHNTNSDLIVSEKSALQDVRQTVAGGGSSTVRCSGELSLGHLPDCWHSALTHNRAVEAQVTDALTKYVASTQPKPVVSPFKKYAGEWDAHNFRLTVSKDGSGKVSYRNYACPDQSNDSGELIMCFVTSQLKLQQQAGKMVAVVTSSKSTTGVTVSEGKPDTRPEAQVKPGTVYSISLELGSNKLKLDTGDYYGNNRTFEACRVGSSEQGNCGP